MFNHNHIISLYHYVILSHVTRTCACTTNGRLAIPYNAITAHDQAIRQYGQEGISSSVPLTHAIHENYKLLSKYFVHIWAVSRESPLPLYGLNHAKILFYECIVLEFSN